MHKKLRRALTRPLLGALLALLLPVSTALADSGSYTIDQFGTGGSSASGGNYTLNGGLQNAVGGTGGTAGNSNYALQGGTALDSLSSVTWGASPYLTGVNSSIGFSFYYKASGTGLNGDLVMDVPAGWPAPNQNYNTSGYVVITHVKTGNYEHTVTINGQRLTIPGINLYPGEVLEIDYLATTPATTGTYNFNFSEAAQTGGSPVLAATAPVTLYNTGGPGSVNIYAGSFTNNIFNSAPAVAGQWTTLDLSYSINLVTAMTGGELDIDVPPGFTPPSTVPGNPGYVRAVVNGSNAGTVSVSGNTIKVASLNLPAGKTVDIYYGDTTSGGPGVHLPPVNPPSPAYRFPLSASLNGTSAPKLADAANLNMNAGPTTAFLVRRVQTTPVAGAFVALSVWPIDQYGNFSGYSGIADFYLDGATTPFGNIDYSNSPPNVNTPSINTVGVHTVVVKARTNPAITGTLQFYVNVRPNFGGISLTAPAKVNPGQPFQITVQSTDYWGNPNASLTGTTSWTSTDTAWVKPAATGTASGGAQTYTVTLNTLGNQTITASNPNCVPGSSIVSTWPSLCSPTVTVNVAAATPTHLGVTGLAAGAAGTGQTITITALDASNNPVTAYSGTISLTSTDSQVAAQTCTASAGSCTLTFTPKTAGSLTLTATDTANNLTGGAGPVTIDPGPAASFALSGAPSPSTPAGSSFTLTVTAKDAYGNTVSSGSNAYTGSHSLIFSGLGPSPSNKATATDSGSTAVAFGAATSLSFSAGSATTSITPYKATASASVTAAVGALSGQTGNFAVTVAAPSQLLWQQQPVGAAAGAALATQPTVGLTDAYGNVITTDSTDKVTLSLQGGTGTLSGNATATLQSGIASFSGLSVSQQGTYTLKATINPVAGIAIAAITSTPFTVGAVAPTHLGVTGLAAGAAGTGQLITITALDAGNNPVTSYSGTILLTSTDYQIPNQTCIASAGSCNLTITPQTAGSLTLNATDAANNLTGSAGPVTIAPGPASQLLWQRQPGGATAGAALAPQPTVSLTDAYGNVITTDSTNTVTLTLQAGTGTLNGNAAATLSKGVASFSGLTVSQQGTYTLKAATSAGGVLAITSASFTISPPPTPPTPTPVGDNKDTGSNSSNNSNCSSSVQGSNTSSLSACGGSATVTIDPGTITVSSKPTDNPPTSQGDTGSTGTPTQVSLKVTNLDVNNLPGLNNGTTTGSTGSGSTGSTSTGSTGGTKTPAPLPSGMKAQTAVEIDTTITSSGSGSTGGSTPAPVHYLSKPVTLTFHVDPANLTTHTEITVAYYDTVLGVWVALPTTIDPATGTVTTSVTHFTTFAVFASSTTTSAVTSMPNGTAATDLVSIIGTSKAAATITVYDNRVAVTSVTLTQGGSWSIPVRLQNGTNSLLVVSGEAGGTLGIGESLVTYTAPAAPAPVADQGGSTTAVNPQITDLAGYDWAKDAIVSLASQNIMHVSAGGTFQPGRAISRAEFVDALVRALNLQGTTILSFTDSAGIDSSMHDNVATAVAAGLLTGYPDGSLRPNAPITRAEAAILLTRALKLVPLKNIGTTMTFTDATSLPAWAADAIAQVAATGLMQGYTDGGFHAGDNLTKAQAAVLISQYLKLKK